MNLNELKDLCIEVLKDWRVIVGVLVFIIFSSLAGYVLKYRKKPRPKKVKHVPAPKPAKKEPTENEEEEPKA
ncbi:MAG: hypothetical protein VZR56_08820 [Treponema sp.]|jgi:hypothetical protein|nr:hypothetical protein [Treponema sp.]